MNYEGSVKSALSRARKILRAAGFPMGKVVGRYHPFMRTQTIEEGITVHRVGCSRNVAVGAYTTSHMRHPREREAIETLRNAGMPFDEKGWLACSYE